MRDINRLDELYDKLKQLHTLNPDLRMGQLVSNLFDSVRQDPFFLEDDKFVELVDREIEKNKVVVNTYTCEFCNKEVQVKDDEMIIGYVGMKSYTCPNCSEINETDDFIDINKDNLIFPTHYYHFKGGVELSDDKINMMVRECIEYLEEHKDTDAEQTRTIGTGDTLITVTRNDDEYLIVVSKDRYEVEIPIDNK